MPHFLLEVQQLQVQLAFEFPLVLRTSLVDVRTTFFPCCMLLKKIIILLILIIEGYNDSPGWHRLCREYSMPLDQYMVHLPVHISTLVHGTWYIFQCTNFTPIMRKNTSLLYQSKHRYETGQKTKVHHNSRHKKKQVKTEKFKEVSGLPVGLFVYTSWSLGISSHRPPLLVPHGELWWRTV